MHTNPGDVQHVQTPCHAKLIQQIRCYINPTCHCNPHWPTHVVVSCIPSQITTMVPWRLPQMSMVVLLCTVKHFKSVHFTRASKFAQNWLVAHFACALLLDDKCKEAGILQIMPCCRYDITTHNSISNPKNLDAHYVRDSRPRTALCPHNSIGAMQLYCCMAMAHL